MLVKEAIRGIRIELQKLDTSSYRDIKPEVAVYWLNKASVRILKQRFERNNIKYKGFEESRKRIDDLKEDIVYVALESIVAGFFDNSREFTLPLDHWFSIMELANVSYLNCNKQVEKVAETEIEIVSHANIGVIRVDPFNKPEKDNVLGVYQGRKLIVLHDNLTVIDKVKLGYLKETGKIPYLATYTEEKLPFGDNLHDEILDEAIHMIKLAIESKTFNANESLINKQE